MDSKKPSRRKFLTTSAAVAGLAVGGVAPASAQTAAPEAEPKKRLQEPDRLWRALSFCDFGAHTGGRKNVA